MIDRLPYWAHPRSPLVAISLRKVSSWDSRVHLYTNTVLDLLVHFAWILIVSVPFFALVFYLGGQRFFSLFTFTILGFFGPLMLVSSEFLYIRLWLGMPTRTSDMIAGEVERQTWDIMRSTPFPRHQLVLSKVAALGWMMGAELRFIFIMRILFFSLLFLIRLTEDNATPQPYLFGYFVWLICLILIPFFEIFMIGALGLFISANAESPRQANLISLLAQTTYRFISVGLLFFFFLESTTRAVLPALLFPQWVFIPIWHQTDYSSQLVVGIAIVFIVLPFLMGTTMLWATVRHIQN